MRTMLGILLSVWATVAHANDVDCLLEVRGTSYLDGVCNGEFRQGGSFTLGLGGEKNSQYFVSVERNSDGTATAHWNGRPGSNSANYPLGTLSRSGACWIGEQTKVCAWKIGEDRWFADSNQTPAPSGPNPRQSAAATAQAQAESPSKLAKRPLTDQAAQQAVMTYFENELKDPESARYRFMQLKLGTGVFSDGFATTMLKPGWYVCGRVNARNSFGGYPGETAFLAHFDAATGEAVDEGYIKDIKTDVDVLSACDRFYSE
jgi:hypothetical protein